MDGRISSCARWLIVLVGSFAVLVVVMTPGAEELFSVHVASQALIYAYALAGAYVLYDLFGRGAKSLPPPNAIPSQSPDSRA